MQPESTDTSDDPTAVGRGALRRPLMAGLSVGLAGLLVTGLLAVAFAADSRADVVAHLDRTATDVDVQVNRRLEAAESALLATAAQVSTGVASPEELQWVLANTGVVEQVPGLLAMLYAQASVTPEGLRVAPRAIHPLSPNVRVLGRNILQDPERRRAIEAARDTGRTAATSVVVHADGGVDAILVMVPVYEGSPTSIAARRDMFAGVMIAVVSPTELFADVGRLGVTALVEDLGPSNVVLEPAPPLTEVWNSGEPMPAGARTRQIGFADRTWQLTIAPGEGFPVTSNATAIVAVAGALLSGLLGLLAALLTDRRARLERVVAARTRDLRRANEELERANRLRSQFITTVSHELRTPLTSVIGFIQTVRRFGDDNPRAREEFLARAERNGLLLRRMIEELLDFGRLERGQMALDLRPTDVGRAVAALVEDVAPALGQRQLLVRTEQDAWAAVDHDALERIVANVLSNAVQHAPDAGPIELRVDHLGEWVEVVCCDRGPGFLPEDIPVLFERFVRGSGVMGEGTGIGLAMVNELALAHGGQARLRNRPGGGAEVVVRLPALDIAAWVVPHGGSVQDGGPVEDGGPAAADQPVEGVELELTEIE